MICEGCGGRSANAGNTLIPRDALVMGHTWVLGPRFLNEFRFNYAQADHVPEPERRAVLQESRLRAGAIRRQAPRRTTSRASRGATINFFITGQKIREWRDDFSISASSHNIKFGADVQSTTLHEDAQGNPSGTWTLRQRSAVRPEQRGVARDAEPVNTFTASFPGLIRHQPHHYYQFYVPGRMEGPAAGHAEPRPALRARHVDLE